VDALTDNFPEILRGFAQTLKLFLVSGACSLLFGTVLAAMRVAPFGSLRRSGATYVTLLRNTPLVVLFVLVTFGFPTIDVNVSFFGFAVIALTVYTSAFVCEAVRSGINSVSSGQAEAARAVGMTFTQTLRLVVLPQAVRSVIPPLASIMIALTKNTSVASAFGVVEATKELSDLIRDRPDQLYVVFFGIAAGDVAITLSIAGIARLIESRMAVVR
jgi:glutamate transport system permease protein